MYLSILQTIVVLGNVNCFPLTFRARIVYIFEIIAAVERTIVNAGHAVGYCYICKSAAMCKCITPDFINAARNGYTCEFKTVGECASTDFINVAGYDYVCEPCAVTECTFSDFGYTVRYGHVCKA